MIRKIIKIDKNKCNGCGICSDACHEKAIEIINGKAHLIRDDYCDGLGDCLPACPTQAISFENREALEYDEKAVKENLKKHQKSAITHDKYNSNSKYIKKNHISQENKQNLIENSLPQWPIQIKLVPTIAPYFENCDLLIAADCTAFAYSNIHNDFIKNHVTIIGCPKLDNVDYSEKLSEIIKNNNINTITIIRMEVPCCKGIENFVLSAIEKSNKSIPCKVNVISNTK